MLEYLLGTIFKVTVETTSKPSSICLVITMRNLISQNKALLHKTVLIYLLYFLSSSCFSQTISPAPVMTVGITHYPPYTIIENHHYRGISVDLWRLIAKQLGYNYRFVEMPNPVDQNVMDLSKRLVDVYVGPVTMTNYRSTLASFSRPYAINHVGIVVPVITKPFKYTLLMFIRNFLSVTILISLIGFILYIHIIWFLERGKLASISTSYRAGITFLFWSTLFDIGLNELPTTYTARVTHFLWVSGKGVVISLISAAAITSLHYSYLNQQVKIDPEVDRFSTLAGGASYYYANIAGYDLIPVKTIETGMQMVLDKTVTGYIDDIGASYYYLQEHQLFNELEISSIQLKSGILGIGFPVNDPIIHTVNKTIAYMQEKGIVLDICKKYIGDTQARAMCF